MENSILNPLSRIQAKLSVVPVFHFEAQTVTSHGAERIDGREDLELSFQNSVQIFDIRSCRLHGFSFQSIEILIFRRAW